MGNLKINTNIINKLIQLIKNNEFDKKHCNIYILKENIIKLEEQINRITKDICKIDNEIEERISKFIPRDLIGKANIILYGGGIDFGFVLIPKHIYLNIGNFIENFESMKDTLAHEMYHSRKRKTFKYLISLYGHIDIRNRCLIKVFAPIIEEGIAELIGCDVDFKFYSDSVIKESDLNKKEIYFEKLNSIIEIILFDKSSIDIKDETKNYICTKGVSHYVIGYIVAKEIYLKKGIEGLNAWTINYNINNTIKNYIIACKERGHGSGFTQKIEEWFLFNV